jgi:hypothetical protein
MFSLGLTPDASPNRPKPLYAIKNSYLTTFILKIIPAFHTSRLCQPLHTLLPPKIPKKAYFKVTIKYSTVEIKFFAALATASSLLRAYSYNPR